MLPFVVDKELLRPNVVYYTRSGPVRFSDDEVEELYRSSQALHDSGRRASIPYEHRDDAKPVLLSQDDGASQLTKYNAGYSGGYFRKPDGSFWAKLEIRDPKTAEDIRNGCFEFVSPEITHLFPADGKVWRNVVTHVALTHQPVWKDQTPFHVPPGWVGHDGAVTPASGRLSLTAGAGSIRLSLEDASPPAEVAESLRLGYRIPGGASATGVWVGDGYHEKHVPQKVLTDLDDGAKKDLLRKLAGRHGRRLPRDFAGMVEQGEARPFTPVATEIPAAHVGLHDSLPPFARQHREGEPLLVWEDPADGRTHAVSGHDHLKSLAGDPEARVSVVRVPGATPYDARGGALMAHLLGGTAHPDDLADLFHDGADRDELAAALKEHGHAPDDKLLQHAWGLSLRDESRPKPGPEPVAAVAPASATDTAKSSESTSEEGGAAPASLFSHEPGYDPAEHRWQHWLQTGFADPAERARFAAQHGADRPATHDDFLARQSAFGTSPETQLSHGSDPMFDYESMTEPEKPKEEKEEKGEGKEKKEEPKGEGKKEAPKGDGEPKGAEHKFQAILKKLEKFKVHLDKDKIKTAEDLVAELDTALHALDGAGAADETPAAGAGGKGGEIELKPEGGGGMQYSLLQKDVEALKAELAKRDRENLALADVANKQQFSLIQGDLVKHQKLGHCTKAEVDEWLLRIKSVMGQSRFSVLAPADNSTMVGIFAEIKQMKKVPDGTFTDGKNSPSQGGTTTLMPEGQSTEERLSLAGGSAEEAEKVEASRRYFQENIWSQLGIPVGTNGVK